jgi:DNA-binding transcriptional LysR family regulator
MNLLRKRLPPPGSLIVFEAVARRLGFTAAAQELGISQAAVSRQIRNLEEFVGQDLFRRSHRRVSLTESGAQLFDDVTFGLGRIAERLDYLRKSLAEESVLTIQTTIAFASFWLMPRLSGFAAAHPEIELRLITSDLPPDFAGAAIDLTVVYGERTPPGMRGLRLFGDEILPVASPRFLERHRKLESLEDLQAAPLLNMEPAQSIWLTWEEWFGRLGHKVSGNIKGPRFSSYALVVQAALEGQGIALGWRRMLAPQLARGDLLPVTKASLVPNEAYHLVVPRRDDLPKKIRYFRDWLTVIAQ